MEGRSTRSNSNPNTSISLQDIHHLLTSMKTEIMSSMEENIGKMVKNMEKLDKKMENVISRVGGLEERLNSFDIEQRRQQGEIREMKESLKLLKPDVIKGNMEDICNETTERWRRRKYLIVSGVPEHASGSTEEREEKDIQTISELAKALGLDEFEPEDVSRIGRINSTKSRLLRFKSDSEDRRHILRNAKSLRKSSKFQSIYINPDMTKLQRIRNADLRREVQRRRQNGENVGIRHGQVVELDLNKNFH